MKINELFTAESGIFVNVFSTDFHERYTALFGTNDPVMLDRWVFLKYGLRDLLECITSETYQKLIGSVIAINADKWENVVNLLDKQYDCLNPNAKTTTATRTSTTDSTDTNENLNAEKSFNDEQFTDGERNKSNGTTSRKDDESTTSTEIGLGFGVLPTTVIQKEKSLREDEYRRTIIAEIIDEITINIY